MSNPLLARFIPEARDLIESSTSGLLKLEKSPSDAAAVNEVFRAVHTLKGSSGLFDVPALTRLVHVAEDLLEAIRADKLTLDSDIVDKLLGSLDQVGVWINHMELTERLPSDADGISSTLAKALCGHFGGSATPDAQASSDHGDTSTSARLLPPEWLAGFSLDDRFEAFRCLMSGMSITAVSYQPAADCFFNGTDPLALTLNAPGVCNVRAIPVVPFAAVADLDPYQCNLRFTLLSTSPVDQIEQHLRYELDHVAMAPVTAADLIVVTGLPSASPVWEDFSEEALRLLAEGDLAGLRARIMTLRGMMGADLAAVAALRWAEVALSAATPDRSILAALIEATTSGTFADPGHHSNAGLGPVSGGPVSDATAPTPQSRKRTLGLNILATQRRGLEEWPFDAEQIVASASAVTKLATALDRSDVHADIDKAADQSLADRSFAPFLQLLDWLNGKIVSDEAPGADIHPVLPIADKATPDHPTADHPAGDGRALPKTVKVDQAKIDLLMNLIGELVVSKNSLPFLAKRAEDVHGSREMSREIKDQYAVIDRLAQEMQSTIMQVRMLPFSDVFDRFPRLVRDLARKLSKEIELTVVGGDTAADKTIIEGLGDPLLHIVRNSLDHGIEQPDIRIACGKPAKATITLKAYQEADHVVIEVRDDGRGIDPARIRAAAVGKGVIDQAEADRLSDQEAINLIFRPGFSTAAEISDLSGRGVGMDVVRTTVEKLGGSVTVSSTVGEGSQTRLELPLSMAVTRVMIVEAAGGLYGVPMDLIVETVRMPTSRIHKIKQAEAFVLRERLIPLERMARVLGQPARSLSDEDQEAILVCRIEGRYVGLVIDDFRVGMDVVLKPLEGIVAGLRGFSGTTLLGDGRVLLVLDLKELL